MFTSAVPLRRLLTFTTALTMLAPMAFAQDAEAPPSRVGQIAMLDGNVSFNGSNSGGWAQAALNYPVTAGDTVYTQDGAQAAIALDASRITLAVNTELQVTALDADRLAATQNQGEAFYAIDYLQPGQQFAITTPRGTIGISQNGRYDIIAGDADTPTTVNVYQGNATVTDPGASLQVTAGQAAYLTGTDQTVAQIGQAQQDGFAQSILAQNTLAPPSYAPPVVRQMTGTAELGRYGSWDQSPQYGAVWYPSVASGWAPYREGHWADIQPWGWTWVESEPWGFAPFHYGRWIDAGGRWGWAPAPSYSEGSYGASYQPVYAPAVVSFFGVALAAGITAAVLSSGQVGWVPLAPNEPYYPTYRCPPAYIRQINVVNVRNINVVNVTNNYSGNFAPDRLANRRAATFVPADVMSHGEHVAGYAHPASQNTLTAARPVDPGFGNHPSAEPGSHPAAFRLPEAAAPLAQLRPGIAPHLTQFAQRRSLPPASVSHAPFVPHAPAMPVARPELATAPGYHPPAGLPAVQHPGSPPAQIFHPAPVNPAMPAVAAAHPLPQVHYPTVETHQPPALAHPQSEPFHPPAQPPMHPPAQVFQPPMQAYHPPVQQFHPQAVAQPRPMQMQHAQPAPHEQIHEEHTNHPDGKS